MHELSIVLGIVDLAEKEISKAGKKQVTLIEMEIGKLSGVEMDALNYVWDTAVKNTVLEHAQRKIDIIEGEAVCMDCGERFAVEKIYDNCPKCGSYLKNIVKGKELRVKALEVI
jgi:hydrogenase nickel incorporation protein HypA/HybF